MMLKGTQEVLKNLNTEIRKIRGRTMVGLIEAAYHVRYDMDKTSPTIPVDTGNLRYSWFVTPKYAVNTPAVVFGFNANYAAFVHESVDAKNWKRPGSGAKFLEYALKRNKNIILKIIAQNAKVR